jgi:hypothetical protein
MYPHHRIDIDGFIRKIGNYGNEERKREMSNSLATRSFSEIMSMGDVFYKSGLFKDLQSAAQAVIKIQAGAELGLPAFASMSGIAIIQGKAVLGANLIATLVENDPRYEYKVIRSDDAVCEIAFFKNGKESGRVSFTMKEAENAGLTGKDNWRKYPSDMLFARCISRGTRRFAPGVFGGAPVYTPDELNIDTDEDGQVITVESIPVEHDAPMPIEKNGNGNTPAMDIKTAMAVMTREDKPRSYGSLTDEELDGRVIRLRKELAKKDISQEHRDDYQYKLSAAVTILNERAKAKKG